MATQEDLPDIVELNVNQYWDDVPRWQKANEYQRWTVAGWWGDQRLLDWHFSVLQGCNGGIIVAENDQNKIVGELDYIQSIEYHDERFLHRYHIIWMLVDEAYRRQGIATDLIHYLHSINDSFPIWVEAEDKRSDRLYNKYGQVIRYLSNWESTSLLPDTSITIQNANLEMYWDKLHDGYIPILGNYYAPAFDITQIRHGRQVFNYLWGNTAGPQLKQYHCDDTSGLAINSQYPRLLVNEGYKKEELAQIIQQVTIDCFSMNFEKIFLQFYRDYNLAPILNSLNYTCEIDKDPVYQIVQENMF